MDKKTMTIVVVALVVIIVAAVAVVAFTGSDDNDKPDDVTPDQPVEDVIAPKLDPEKYKTENLPVFGNANNDLTIDSKDVTVIQNILDRKSGYTPDKYPFADANYDGKINQADIDLVQKIINKQKCTIYHLNYMNDTGENTLIYIKDTKFPTNGAIVAHTSNMTLFKALGLEKAVVATPDKKGGWYDPGLLDYITDDRVISIDDAGNLIDQINAVVDKTGVHTIIAPGYGDEFPEEDKIEKATNCDIVRTCESNPDMPSVYASILLLGFLYDVQDNGQALAGLSKEVYEGVNKIAKSIPESDKVLFACGMSGPTNQHAIKCMMAGGKYAFADTTEELNQWGSYNFGDWVYKFPIDCFIHVSWSNAGTGSFYSKEGPNLTKYYNDTLKYKDMEVYKTGDFDFVYGGVPIAFDFLNRGYAMYPELYGDLYESANQKLYEMFGTNAAGEKYADMGLRMVIPLSEVKAAAGA